MKDPYTLAFKLWFGFKIWHRDAHGVDGACGWSRPHLTKREVDKIGIMAYCEAHDIYFLRSPTETFSGPRAEAECLYRALIDQICTMLHFNLTLEEKTLYAIRRIHNGGPGNGANIFCFKPGYHSNSTQDSMRHRECHFKEILYNIASNIKYDLRPWYKHPRWHIHHWRIENSIIKRWHMNWFTRCKYCHKRLGKHSSITSDWECTSHWHTVSAFQMLGDICTSCINELSNKKNSKEKGS